MVAALALGGCGGSQQQEQQQGHLPYRSPSSETAGEATDAPEWIRGIEVERGRLCGFGVAGAGYDQTSPYPKRLSEERAVQNLAGVLGTRVQEAIIDRQRNDTTSVQTAKVLSVDEALIEKVGSISETEFWLDVEGAGPYAAKGFTYAHTCIDASLAAETFKLDAVDLKGPPDLSLLRPGAPPVWLTRAGGQPDGRLCAVGFSLPTFHPDKTFQNVVEDVRWQLAEVIQTFVSSYYEELSTGRSQAIEAMTLATTEAISKGAIITHYWYDRDGRGPARKGRSTYGFGCVYPVQILHTSTAAVEATAPEDQKQVIAKVRERAATAFDTLDAEIDRRERTTAQSDSDAAQERSPAISPDGAPSPATPGD